MLFLISLCRIASFRDLFLFFHEHPQKTLHCAHGHCKLYEMIQHQRRDRWASARREFVHELQNDDQYPCKLRPRPNRPLAIDIKVMNQAFPACYVLMAFSTNVMTWKVPEVSCLIFVFFSCACTCNKSVNVQIVSSWLPEILQLAEVFSSLDIAFNSISYLGRGKCVRE